LNLKLIAAFPEHGGLDRQFDGCGVDGDHLRLKYILGAWY
jgi:hypothetical protein